MTITVLNTGEATRFSPQRRNRPEKRENVPPALCEETWLHVLVDAPGRFLPGKGQIRFTEPEAWSS